MHPQLWALGHRHRFNWKRQPARSPAGIWNPGTLNTPRFLKLLPRTGILNPVMTPFLTEPRRWPPRSRSTAKAAKWHFQTIRREARLPQAKLRRICTTIFLLFTGSLFPRKPFTKTFRVRCLRRTAIQATGRRDHVNPLGNPLFRLRPRRHRLRDPGNRRLLHRPSHRLSACWAVCWAERAVHRSLLAHRTKTTKKKREWRG